MLELVCRYCCHKGIYVCVSMMARNLQFKVYLGLWGVMNTTIYPPNQPRVIHDCFPFQQKDWIRFWIYHQNNQPEILETQVHFVPYPDPYPFHTRIMPCRTHPPSPPFVDIQVYSTYQIYHDISHILSMLQPCLWWNHYTDMCICIYIIYVCIYFYIYIDI